MDKKKFIMQKLDELKSIFKFDAATGSSDTENPAENAAEPKQLTLADGTICNIPDGMEPGATITMLGTEGETPLAAGEYPLEDGSILKVTEVGKIASITPAVSTEDQSMQAFNAMVSKFAAGTPDERIANLETMCKALMEYNYGWKIREAQGKAAEDAAIAVYNTTLKSAFQSQLDEKFQAIREELNATQKANDVLIAKFKAAGEKVAELTMEFKAISEAVPAPINTNAPQAPKTEAEKLLGFFSKQN